LLQKPGWTNDTYRETGGRPGC